MANLLLIEDDGTVAHLIARTIRATPERHELAVAHSARAGFEHLASHAVDCVLLDYHLPDARGLECLRTLRQQKPDLPVIVITARASEEIAVEAMKLGVSDYIPKHGRYLDNVPIVIGETLGRKLVECSQAVRAASDLAPSAVSRLPSEVRAHYRRVGIVGDSPAIEEALALAERAAQSRATVLLEGESGTGKELFARAIHERSPRGKGRFLAQNCAALSEGVLESELFGHVRGAFTGADRARRGLFEEASGGTLLLDEISETSAAIQAKLLRVLQEREIRPVGSDRSRAVDVRTIAASNRPLRKAVREGRFREDLYYRLSVFPIHLPALRERAGDVRLLAEHFLRELSGEEGKPLDGWHPDTLRQLERYAWPGNVRELQNEIRRLVLCVEPHAELSPGLLASWIRAGGEPSAAARPLKEIVRTVELATIQDRLRQHGYHRQATARSLGMTREALWAKIRQLGLPLPRRGRSASEA